MSDDSAVEAASNWAQAHVDGRLALIQEQITAIARALLSSQSQVERLREALNMARVDLELLSEYGGISAGARAVAKSAHADVCAALTPKEKK